MLYKLKADFKPFDLLTQFPSGTISSPSPQLTRKLAVEIVRSPYPAQDELKNILEGRVLVLTRTRQAAKGFKQLHKNLRTVVVKHVNVTDIKQFIPQMMDNLWAKERFSTVLIDNTERIKGAQSLDVEYGLSLLAWIRQRQDIKSIRLTPSDTNYARHRLARGFSLQTVGQEIHLYLPEPKHYGRYQDHTVGLLY